jgi:hypothetical protein
MRVDTDVLEWLKSQGSGYPSRLNFILRKRHAGSAVLGLCDLVLRCKLGCSPIEYLGNS